MQIRIIADSPPLMGRLELVLAGVADESDRWVVSVLLLAWR
ncbi:MULTISPECIES: hypothetical protein [unclassified Serratia (in: enterobacteria)]|nr:MULTISPECIES: hypothetical protein [unclassified Serratia (in: enterobacteria)]